jgi:hypothetical protein
MDFCKIETKEGKHGIEIYPDFVVGRSNDLMIRGKSFYAVWDERAGLWSRDEYDIQRIVDDALQQYVDTHHDEIGPKFHVKRLKSFNSNIWVQFRKFMYSIDNNGHSLDDVVTFRNTEVTKKDYVSKRLPYDLTPGDCSAWDELVGTLYSEEERAKIEWAIGAVIAGDSKSIQKFLVFYGPPASGKSTILNIIAELFQGYTTVFEARALGSSNGTFATEVFRDNPLVAIQHDGDLSRLEDNTKLNSIISHEELVINEKYKSTYSSRINAFLFMGTNQPVKISDSRSGIIRRLIDVNPSGEHIPVNHYHALMDRIHFELGAIAHHCLKVYQSMGKNYYNGYKPISMMFKTDVFFNFIEAYYDIFKSQDSTTLKQAYALYKEYCHETGIDRLLPQYQFREELKNYFTNFAERATVDGLSVRSYYSNFNAAIFKTESKQDKTFSLVMEETTSLFDRIFEDAPAQYATEDGTPTKRWDSVKTKLSEIDTSKLHYVKVPETHIVIDFDLKDEDGRKSLERNLQTASGLPATYGEYSQSGRGVHLHYSYTGDVHSLARTFSEGIEVKVFSGGSSLRRKFTRGNNVPIATLNGGLPIKEQKLIDVNRIGSEKGLRELIERNLKKEIHPGTKPSIDFIHKILEDAYASNLIYDVTDLRPRIIAFANNSSNQALTSLKIVKNMKFKSAEGSQDIEPIDRDNNTLVFFDVEVYPNLFIVCWKYEGSDDVVRMINPSPQDVEGLFRFNLIGFNNRRYDNHILYARYLGYDNEQLYKLSQKIISGNVGAMFGEAYNVSYADVYDFSSKKQSLKKFQIEIEGLIHHELPLPWDKPVPEDQWSSVETYCANDVLTTEAVFKDRYQDFIARQILADLSGLFVNDTTQKHTAKIIFGNDRTPQKQFIYTDLSKEFPGYVFESGVSVYRGESPGEGGYVYAEPGIYTNVALLDVASMHPTSIRELNLFGDAYTARFAAITDARLAIKRKDYAFARRALGGKLAKYLEGVENDDHGAKDLAFALKIVINIVYGLTSAKFDNAFRDIRNVDNIVAKRGALFMIDLKNYVQNLGYTVAHIKTDSIKIPDASPEIIDLVKVFGEKYGYTFEHEITYDSLCLVNDAVYVARKDADWTAVGAQFQHPYVFKTLFTHEDLVFEDFVETKQVNQGAIYIDFNYDRPMIIPDTLRFVGRIGQFVPVPPQNSAGVLYRVKDNKAYAITGTKGYYWMEAEMAKFLKVEPDMSYFDKLAKEALKAITDFGVFDSFMFYIHTGE